MLCGLQLPGPNNQQLAVQGQGRRRRPVEGVAGGHLPRHRPDAPTSRPTFRSTALRRTRWRSRGAVNLAEKFPAALPPEPDQDAFIKDACTRMTDAYLAPIQLRSTTLTLIYSTISLPSWSAGSHQVSCSIGATLGNGGWSTLLNSAKGPAADQRSAAGSAARHPRGAAEPAADPDRRRRARLVSRRHQLLVVAAQTEQPDRLRSARPSTCRATVDADQTTETPTAPTSTRRLRHRATRSSTGLRRRRVTPQVPPPPPDGAPPPQGAPPGLAPVPPPPEAAPPPAPAPGPLPAAPVPPPPPPGL